MRNGNVARDIGATEFGTFALFAEDCQISADIAARNVCVSDIRIAVDIGTAKPCDIVLFADDGEVAVDITARNGSVLDLGITADIGSIDDGRAFGVARNGCVLCDITARYASVDHREFSADIATFENRFGVFAVDREIAADLAFAFERSVLYGYISFDLGARETCTNDIAFYLIALDLAGVCGGAARNIMTRNRACVRVSLDAMTGDSARADGFGVDGITADGRTADISRNMTAGDIEIGDDITNIALQLNGDIHFFVLVFLFFDKMISAKQNSVKLSVVGKGDLAEDFSYGVFAEKGIDGYVKNIGKRGDQRDIGTRKHIFPFGNGLKGYAELFCERILCQSRGASEFCNFGA